MLVQQADVGELDRGPERLVACLGKTLEQLGHRFVDAQVVHLDAAAGELAPLGPRGALEKRFRLLRRFAEQAIVLVEPGEDAARDVLPLDRAPRMTYCLRDSNPQR